MAKTEGGEVANAPEKADTGSRRYSAMLTPTHPHAETHYAHLWWLILLLTFLLLLLSPGPAHG